MHPKKARASLRDAENARLVYTWLENLTPALAMEERLWACMTHRMFPEYMAARWPVTTESDVLRRYLLEGQTFAALTRNGIARLWWAGYLTKSELREDPFELTHTLFMRQDIHVSLLERSLGKCENARVAVLDFLRSADETFTGKAFGRRIQRLLLELNLLGGVSVLDALPPSTLAGHVARAARRAVEASG